MPMPPARFSLACSAALVVLAMGHSAAAATCESLSSLSLPDVTVTTAQSVAAGAFAPPARGGGPGGGGRGRGPQFTDLPATGWNGKFRGTGNGGLGGGAGVNAGQLATGVRAGYAAAGNNTGHEGDSSYAMDHPEKIKDFGYRSAHEMTVASKALISAFYGSGAKVSYMAEGGGGTIAALSSAQRYPQDYDAIAVTGMSSYLTRHTFGQMWIWQATHKDAASFIPPDKYPVLHRAALDACDGLDGLKDGVIGDVLHCRFDPGVTLCKAPASPGNPGNNNAPDCLTAPQVEAAREIYAGPKNPRTGQEIYSPLYPGSELGWGQLAGGDQPLGIPVEFFKYYVLRDPNWDYNTRPINFDSDVTASNRPEIQPVNAVDPDLSKFFRRGGKLLLVDGWSDTSVPPKVAINYYNAVVARLGAKTVKASMRFFMVPGMGHGPGTNGPENFNFDALGLIERWKEQGQAPDQLIVSHFKDGMEVGKRLVCQYPQIAIYKGGGGQEDPGSYTCK